MTLLPLLITAVFFLAACGTSSPEPENGASGASAGQDNVSDTELAGGSDESTGAEVTGAGGLDPQCVATRLGREVSSFADLTPAELRLVTQACGGAAAQGVTGPGGFPFDISCITATLGREFRGAADLTEEESRLLSEECGFGGGIGPGQFGTAFNPECAAEALGREVSDFSELTPEERQETAAACVPEGLTGGGPGAGQFGPAFNLVCLTDALGREVTDFQTLTPEERQTAIATCAPERVTGGGPGFGPGQLPGGSLQRFGGQGFPGGGLAGLDPECVEVVAGRSVDSIQELTAEQQAAVISICSPQP
jgi:hypothetical protein